MKKNLVFETAQRVFNIKKSVGLVYVPPKELVEDALNRLEKEGNAKVIDCMSHRGTSEIFNNIYAQYNEHRRNPVIHKFVKYKDMEADVYNYLSDKILILKNADFISRHSITIDKMIDAKIPLMLIFNNPFSVDRIREMNFYRTVHTVETDFRKK